jgi:hypothetical protein
MRWARDKLQAESLIRLYAHESEFLFGIVKQGPIGIELNLATYPHHDGGGAVGASEDGGFGLPESVEIFIANHTTQESPEPEAQSPPYGSCTQLRHAAWIGTGEEQRRNGLKMQRYFRHT